MAGIVRLVSVWWCTGNLLSIFDIDDKGCDGAKECRGLDEWETAIGPAFPGSHLFKTFGVETSHG